MSTIFYLPKQSPLDTASNLMAGAKLYFYVTLTSTPKDTYADYARTTPNANPVIADGSGTFQTIYLTDVGLYRVVLKTSADVTLYTQDDVGGPVATQAELGAILYPLTTAENAAGVTIVNYFYPPGDVRRYGTNTTPGTTDMTAAIQAAIDQHKQGGVYVQLPNETLATGALTYYTGTVIIGSGRTTTTLKYTGSTQLFKQSTPGTRIYGVRMIGFFGDDQATGTIGLDLDSVSESFFEDLTFNGFDTGIKIYSPTSGYSVYDRFIHIKAQNATTGFWFTGTSSNSHSLIACRGNVCTDCVLIADGNQNSLIDCQFESSTRGVKMTGSAPGLTLYNSVIACRFENNSGFNITLDANCTANQLIANAHVSAAGGAVSDSGTRTISLPSGDASTNLIIDSATGNSTGPAVKLSRSTNAGSSVPVVQINDTNTGSGTPQTLEINTERNAGVSIAVKKGGTTNFYVQPAGQVVLTGAAPTVASGQLGIGATHATTVGAAGGATALPATPTAYLIVNIDGTQFKIPYYAT